MQLVKVFLLWAEKVKEDGRHVIQLYGLKIKIQTSAQQCRFERSRQVAYRPVHTHPRPFELE